MKTKILLTFLVMGVLYACSKDKFNTKPKLTLKSVSTKVVPFNGALNFEFEVTDKEGDISDSLYVKKVRINRRVVQTIRDSFAFKLPSVPNTQTTFVSIDMAFNNHLISAINPPSTGNPPVRENDTLLFKFILKDKAKNLSDTFVSEPIVIKRQ